MPQHPEVGEVGADPVLTQLFAPLEAVLMVVDHPVPAVELAEALGVGVALVEKALEALAAQYRGAPASLPSSHVVTAD
ncbi:MAG: hypothetical protein L0H81_03770, partial [Actinomyces sp.]|nr:hypothetical protein [Actinomyces sp.]